MPKAGSINGCVSGREKVPGTLLWLSRRNKGDGKDDFF